MIELPRLGRWATILNACIRCGYCFEHCPIFKSTRWETDSPRAKLTLLYGLMHGEVEPAEELVEKMFECFHCKRCETACSSGVPVTQVFADARADLLDAGFEPEGTISFTEHDLCARCLNCVRMCPHEARSFRDGRIVTDRRKCQSCGSCLDVCSARGIFIRKGYGTNPAEQREELARFLDDPANPEAKAVVFTCTWSSFPGCQYARLVGREDRPEHKVLITACTGRLRTSLVLDALELGAWGVLVTRCPEDECDHGGSARGHVRIRALQGWLGQIGIDSRRLQVTEIPKGDPKAFGAAVGAFLEGVRGLGPLREGGIP